SGNMSARKDERRYWMSASGVDKSNLREVGRDVLMVKDFDAEAGKMILSVPPGIEPRRASVDAIEHWMIYREHPEVGAIVHVHAWIPGVQATEFNYPCGTAELAGAVGAFQHGCPPIFTKVPLQRWSLMAMVSPCSLVLVVPVGAQPRGGVPDRLIYGPHKESQLRSGPAGREIPPVAARGELLVVE